MTTVSLHSQTQAVAEFLRASLPDWDAPTTFVQMGSGLDATGLLDEVTAELPLAELPSMPVSASPAAHALRLVLGRCGRNQVLVSLGRRHLYEGFGAAPCVLPVCGAAQCGIRNIVLLCAAGGVRHEFVPGALMVATDYINNLGTSPLVGPEPLGASYFVSVNEAFSQGLVSSFINTAATCELYPRLGVYQANLGPQYETPAEVEAARRNGVDAVGMSLVLETIAAAALGCRTLGLALITNRAASHGEAPPAHEDVAETGRLASPRIMQALNRWLAGDLPE